jgi:hypothetical protein
MLRAIGVGILSLMLFGCGSARDHEFVSTRDLCEKIANTPIFNVNRAARIDALRKRGKNCDDVYDNSIKVDQNITIKKLN